MSESLSLQRSEIIALIHMLAKLSDSIVMADEMLELHRVAQATEAAKKTEL